MIEMDKEVKRNTAIKEEASDISTEEHKNEKEKMASGHKKTSKSKKTKSRESNKIKELQERIKILEQEKEQLRDQALRKMAEFDNYKRRTDKEFLAVLQNASENLIMELLPVLDDFERFLEHAENSGNAQSLVKGVELIYKKLSGILEKQGLKKMETIGQEFDPEKHQALMQVDSDKHESGHVVDEHLKGYMLNDKVIRHSQVLVAK
ncbi:MAG TPA: nucleotide exchange factor GrpE [Calditrichaeota bacterium]|nr:nucleotide exchange factor GrpE [Calditrichota bacterium]